MTIRSNLLKIASFGSRSRRNLKDCYQPLRANPTISEPTIVGLLEGHAMLRGGAVGPGDNDVEQPAVLLFLCGDMDIFAHLASIITPAKL
jgi:hypothetical protein